MSDLYNNIETLAKERGFKNISALCTAAGIPRATMTELKKGRSKSLLPDTAKKIASALNVSLDAVYRKPGASGEETPAATTGSGLTDAQRELMSLIPTMTPGEVSVLLATAKAQAAVRTAQDDRR